MHTLEELEGLQGHLTEERHAVAAQSYQQGMACLAQAQAEGFKNPARLKEASAHLLEAIRHQHHLPDPYIGMAYLMLLLNQRSDALHYLDEALRIEPSNPSAASLRQLIHTDSPLPQTGPHFTRRFEALLEQTIRTLSQSPPPVPCAEIKAYLQLETEAIELRRHYDELHDLAEETERDRLVPIAKRLALFEKALHASCELLDLHEQLQEEQETAASLDQLTETHTHLVQQELAHTLDHCDALADEINALESEGIPVAALEKDYEALAGTVEHLQAHLQEKGNPL